jgi:hypothetical protein
VLPAGVVSVAEENLLAAVKKVQRVSGGKVGSVEWMQRRLPAFYLAFVLVLTTVMCWVTPPFFGPDEPSQSLRALALLQGDLLPKIGANEAGSEVDTGALDAMDGMDAVRMRWENQSPDFHDRSYGPVTAESQSRWAYVRWSGQKRFVGFGNTATYPPGLYLPEIVGWRIAQEAKVTIFASLRLVRWLTALMAALVGWLALRWAGAGAWGLLAVLLAPSALFLEATGSQDALMLPVAALAVAVVWRALCERRELGRAELIAATVPFALCAMAKPPYVALALLMFVPAAEFGVRGWKRWMGPAIGFAVVAGSSASWWRLAARFGVDTADEADPVRQMAFLRGHPVAAAMALGRGTADAAWDFVHRGLYVVGWNDLLPHHGAALVLSVCLLVIAWCAPGVGVRSWRARLLMVIAVVVPLVAISVAEYVIWTPPGLATVYGVQPRYWLPVLPGMMLLATGWRAPRIESGQRREWLLRAATTVLVCVACTLPWMAARAFYRAGLIEAVRINLQ